MDNVLIKGGDLEALATQAGVTKSMLRAHAKYRAKNAMWKLTEDGDKIKMAKVPAAAA